MKFELVFKTAKENFPNEYMGHFLEYDMLKQVMKLAKIPGNHAVHYANVEAPNGVALFFKVLELDLKKINEFFDKAADQIIHQWRVFMKMESPKTPDAPPVLEHKVALNARHCFQYVKLNEAALKRILGEFDDEIKSRKGQQFREEITTGSQTDKAFFMHSSKVEELRAIFRLYDIYHEEEKADDKRMSEGAIAMELFDCSFTENWVPDLGDMSPYCHGCKKPMENPKGIKCGHIICEPCLVSMCGSAVPKACPQLAGRGVDFTRLKYSPFNAQCPKCKVYGVAENIVDCTALGLLFKETEEKRVKQEEEEKKVQAAAKAEQERLQQELARLSHLSASGDSVTNPYMMQAHVKPPKKTPSQSATKKSPGPFMPVVFPK